MNENDLNADVVMRGPHNIPKMMAAFMQYNIPRQVQIAETNWEDLTEGGVVLPVLWDAESPYEIDSDQYPAIGCYVTHADNYRRYDITNQGSNIYESQWDLRMFVACKTQYLGYVDGYDQWEQPPRTSVIRRRNDLTSIVLNALLAYPDLDSNGEFYLDEGSLSVDYTEPIPTGDPSVWIASSTIAMTARLTEVAVVLPLGQVDSTILTVQQVPRGQVMQEETEDGEMP